MWGALLIASAGVLSHSGIKIPFTAFFAHDSGKRPAEAPTHMLWAMGITATLCIGIGVVPGALYALLPYAVDYHPYSFDHVLTQFQLLAFALLAFVVLMKTGLHPHEMKATNIDSDWIYHRITPRLVPALGRAIDKGWSGMSLGLLSMFDRGVAQIGKFSEPRGLLARGWGINSMVFILTVLMGLVLLFNFGKS